MFKRRFLALACLPAFALSAPVHAQDSAAGNQALSLDQMVVTTRKRAEVLQDVPVAITAFSSEEIKDANIQDLEDIALLTPGLTFTELFGNVGNPVIRGINTTIGEPNVGLFIDGVYQESRSAMNMLFGDEIERIEVAKGPQSALFGRNTFAGAINYVTKKPGNDNGGQLELTLGNKGKREARLSYSGAITQDTLFYRVGAMHSGFDGFYTNEKTGGDLDNRQSNGVSMSLLAIPRDDMEMTLRVAYDNTNDGDNAMQFVPNNAYGPLTAIIPAYRIQPQLLTGKVPSLKQGYAVTPGYNHRDNLMSSFKLDWDFDTVTLTAITGYNHLRLNYATDTDYTANDVQFTREKTGQTEFSQELRLTSVDQPVRWMAGVYFYNLDRDYRQNITGSGAVNLLTQEGTKNWAGFGSVGVDLTKQLAVTFEGRYAYERKKISVANVGLPPTYADHAVFNHFTPKVALDYKVTPDMMLYASVAKAVKSGGFNTAINGVVPQPNERKYNEEKSWNYELGLKSSWLNKRLTTNVAVFYIDWKDQIVRALGAGTPPAVLNDNAGRSSSRGIELELAAKPAKNWDISAGLTYTHAKYDKYTFAALPLFGLDPVLDGNPMQYVPDWTANASVQYVKPAALSGFDWKTRLDVSYRDALPTLSVDNGAVLPSRTIVNVHTGLENNQYSITLWVNNLFNDDAPLSAVAIPNPSNPLQAFNGLVQGPAKRTLGITGRMKF